MRPNPSKAPTAFGHHPKKHAVLWLLFLLPLSVFSQQSITGIITDYNSYWKTSVSSINPIKPVNSHNLLAFTFNGTQYSTGVNDATLSSRGQNFVPGDFWSLPLAGYSGTINSNTKVGLGQMYDGVHNGRGSASYPNTITQYLNDGIKGLNIGTCVANLPAGTISFLVSNIRPANIGDGIPDILVTQVADPSGSADRYSFINASGAVIGTTREITFNSIQPVANWTADFYEASNNPMTLTPSFTNTDRPMRLWAADLSDFGITQANYTSLKNFRINLSGNSDVAFVAYNNKTFNIAVLLPVQLGNFTARESNGQGILNWTTVNETGADYFVVEKSSDGTNFSSIDTVKAIGNSTGLQQYVSQDRQLRAGINYYRLKMVDNNSTAEYSKTVQLAIKQTEIRLFPNPASEQVTVTHGSSSVDKIKIYNASGVLMQQKRTAPNSYQTVFDIRNLAKGMYYLVCEGDREKLTRSFVKK